MLPSCLLAECGDFLAAGESHPTLKGNNFRYNYGIYVYNP